MRKLFSFGFFTTLCNIIDSIYENIITFLFGKYISVSASGLFDQAKKIESASVQSIVQTTNAVSFPVLSKKKNDMQDFENEAISIYQTCIILICPVLYFVAVYAKEIIGVVYGEKWLGASSYLSVLMIIGVFYFLESLLRNNIKSLGFVNKLAYYTVIKRVFSIVLMILLIFISPLYMLVGYLLGTVIGVLVNCYLYSKTSSQKLSTVIQTYTKPLLCTAPSLIVLILIHNTNIINYTLQFIILFMASMGYYLYYAPKVCGVDILNRNR